MSDDPIDPADSINPWSTEPDMDDPDLDEFNAHAADYEALDDVAAIDVPILPVDMNERMIEMDSPDERVVKMIAGGFAMSLDHFVSHYPGRVTNADVFGAIRLTWMHMTELATLDKAAAGELTAATLNRQSIVAMLETMKTTIEQYTLPAPPAN